MWSGGNVTASGTMDCCDCKLQNYRLVVMWTCRTVDWWKCGVTGMWSGGNVTVSGTVKSCDCGL